VEVVIESTGRFRTRAGAAQHLEAGAKGEEPPDATVVLSTSTRPWCQLRRGRAFDRQRGGQRDLRPVRRPGRASGQPHLYRGSDRLRGHRGVPVLSDLRRPDPQARDYRLSRKAGAGETAVPSNRGAPRCAIARIAPGQPRGMNETAPRPGGSPRTAGSARRAARRRAPPRSSPPGHPGTGAGAAGQARAKHAWCLH
jgi:hypothetical protein